ncbi:nicotinamide ribonucleoside (NR) uptake permease (PnuC) family protein [Candidatus Francisella endociliophora]|uniref:Nicotinamide riboside transporter PnuC n=1 Tax=Candidatus Francisella endociliophora TaxID=653937 RepID=A0A097EPX6_9GAMM|nr:nicotinamide riboside transporter PnuC [Francisella sp. FSC1006]AIT09629.1 nicotinamide ribonucleoside (NR) uptake permease (PnuC) family protein [Francisella sp. FSC1006]
MLHILDFCTMAVNLLCTFLLASFYTIGWPVGILGLIMSTVLFFISKLYADAILQIILMFSFVYGWYSWRVNKQNKSFSIQRLSLSGWVVTIFLIVLVGMLVSSLLIEFTKSTTPYLDGFTSVASLVCVLLASRKIIDNWIIWIVVDSTYIVLYLYKDLFFATITTIVYVIIAIYGYKHWKKVQGT